MDRVVAEAKGCIGLKQAMPPPLRHLTSNEGLRYDVIVVLMNGIGDGFLALPLIRYVMSLCSRHSVIVWAGMHYAATVFHEISDLLVPTTGSHRPHSCDMDRELKAVRSRLSDRPVIWINLNTYPPSGVELHVQEMVRPAFVFNVSKPDVRRDQNGKHRFRIDQYFRVIGEDGLPEQVDRKPQLDSAVVKAGLHRKQAATSLGKQLIVVHAETGREKQWPVAAWVELGHMLAPHAVLVELGRSHLLPEPFEPAPSGWAAQAAVLMHAHGFIGIDSSWAHVADACGIPGIVLFGPTSPEVWGPKGEHLRPLVAPHGQVEAICAADVVRSYWIQFFGGDWGTRRRSIGLSRQLRPASHLSADLCITPRCDY